MPPPIQTIHKGPAPIVRHNQPDYVAFLKSHGKHVNESAFEHFPIPTGDGEIQQYQAVLPSMTSPLIYYVNGIQTDGKTHAQTALMMSLLTETTIHGVFNKSAGKGIGMLGDLGQCFMDWSDIFSSKLLELGTGRVNQAINATRHWFDDVMRKATGNRRPPFTRPPVNVAEAVRNRIPEPYRLQFAEWAISQYNKATASLFHELQAHRNQPQIIIAHSQGNLITADALMNMAIAYGEHSMSNMKVYSLASPSPAWPIGIRNHRRKVYGYVNDPVPWTDPHNWTWLTDGTKFARTAGHWASYDKGWQGIDPHDLGRNALLLNFAKSIRRDLGLPPLPADVIGTEK